MDYRKEWVLNLVLDFLENTPAEKIKMEAVSQWLTDFRSRQFHDLEKGGPDEEYDPKHVFDFVIENLGEELQTYLFGQQEERKEAKAAILLNGIQYAAKEKCSVKKVKGLLNTVLDLMYEFMEGQTGLREPFHDFLKRKKKNLVTTEETVAGKTLLLRYIFLYKNEKDRILYLRAAALLKDDGE